MCLRITVIYKNWFIAKQTSLAHFFLNWQVLFCLYFFLIENLKIKIHVVFSILHFNNSTLIYVLYKMTINNKQLQWDYKKGGSYTATCFFGESREFKALFFISSQQTDVSASVFTFR